MACASSRRRPLRSIVAADRIPGSLAALAAAADARAKCKSKASPQASAPAAAPPPAAISPSEATTTYNTMSTPPLSGVVAPAQPIDFASLQDSIKVANAADVSLDIVPGPDIAVGSRVSFRVSTKKAGYLILVDVDATGKLTQIYPNPISLMGKGVSQQSANYLKPGKSVQIPDPSDPDPGFRFVAAAPFGTAMVVAIMSDRPVQLVDLPDVPNTLIGRSVRRHLPEQAHGRPAHPRGRARPIGRGALVIRREVLRHPLSGRAAAADQGM